MTEGIVVETRLSEIKIEIHQRLKRNWEDVVAIGRLAAEAKALIPHGGFTLWIKDELGLSPRIIQGYMRVNERFGKTANFSSMPISGLLMLASPSVSDGVIAEISNRVSRGEKFSVEAVEGVIDRYKVLEGAQLGSRALLENFGTKADGTPAKVISRSAITSLVSVASEGLRHGAVTLDGQDHSVSAALPQSVLFAMQQETKRRQSDHIDDRMPTKVRAKAVVCQLPEDPTTLGYVMLRISDRDVVKQLSEGKEVMVEFVVKG